MLLMILVKEILLTFSTFYKEKVSVGAFGTHLKSLKPHMKTRSSSIYVLVNAIYAQGDVD